MAAELDRRINNHLEWKLGLKRLSGGGEARYALLPDSDVLALVAAGYEVEPHLGLLLEFLAVTGTRLSQAARTPIAALEANRPDPRVSIPSSKKGDRKRKAGTVAVPITSSLAVKLLTAAEGRAVETPLLVRSDGRAWGYGSAPNLLYFSTQQHLPCRC